MTPKLEFTQIGTGLVNDRPDLVFSEGFQLSEQLYCLASCTGQPEPIVYVRETSMGEFEVVEPEHPPVSSVHVRNMAKCRLGDSEYCVFLDHGLDAPPFPGGGLITVLIDQGKVLEQRVHSDLHGFFFDGLIVETSEAPVLLVADLQQEGLRAFAISSDSGLSEIKLQLPLVVKKLGSVLSLCQSSASSFLLGAGKASDRSILCELVGDRVRVIEELPRHRNPGWETNFIARDKSGVWTLSHSLAIDEPNLEVFSDGQARELPSEIRRLESQRGIWFHRAEPFVTPQSLRPGRTINIRKAHGTYNHDEVSQTIFVCEGEQGLQFVEQKGLPGDRLFVIYKWLSGGRELLAMDCHGHWSRYSVSET
jgi:hypothetical protein